MLAWAALVSAAMIGAAASSGPHRDLVPGAPPRVTIDSAPFVVWDTRDTACEKAGCAFNASAPHGCTPLDLPDTPPTGYVDNRGVTRVYTGDTTTRSSYGPSILNLTRNCTIVFNATNSPDPSLYAADEFVDAVYAFDNGTVYALLHVEFHAYCDGNTTTYPYCWTVAMTLAVSHDWGDSWAHALPPPQNMVAAPPYKYTPSGATLNAGWGDSSGIVRSPRDGFFYAIVHNRFEEGLQKNGSCVIRTNDLTSPTSWRGWGGETFDVAFHPSPYTTPPPDPKDHVCTVLDLPDCVVLGLVWSVYLEKYVASMSCGDENGGDSSPSFYYATSEDMIHWSDVEIMYTPPVPPAVHFYSYPTLRDPAAPSRGDRNYGTIGQTATLFYVSVTHNFYTEGRQLYAVNVTFHK